YHPRSGNVSRGTSRQRRARKPRAHPFGIRQQRAKMPGKKVVVNLAPADIRKEGSSLDLTIAVAILAAAGYVSPDRLGAYVVMGELSLDGSLKPIRGALPIAVNARREGFRGFILPRENAPEAAVAEGLDAIAAGSL